MGMTAGDMPQLADFMTAGLADDLEPATVAADARRARVGHRRVDSGPVVMIG